VAEQKEGATRRGGPEIEQDGESATSVARTTDACIVCGQPTHAPPPPVATDPLSGKLWQHRHALRAALKDRGADWARAYAAKVRGRVRAELCAAIADVEAGRPAAATVGRRAVATVRRVYGGTGRDRVYLPSCPHCGRFHEFRVLDSEWNFNTTDQGAPGGATRRCPTTGELVNLVATRERGPRSW
jgi:hypothetical protein